MPKVSQAHLDARRQQVLDGATKCFADNGFHRTTIQDIVRESGLSAGAIYRYFTSKDDIIQAIANERHINEWRGIREATDQTSGADALWRLARSFFERLLNPAQKQHRRVGIEMWAEALHSPSILATAREGINEPLRLITEILAKARDRGEVPAGIDPEALGRIMIAVFQGFVLQQAWDDAPVEPYLEAVGQLLDLVFVDSRS